MKRRFLILDCFVDEPACLGVPPFVASYPRYIYGALLSSGADPGNIDYTTISEIRENDYLVSGAYAVVFIIGGAVVPGRYLGARIGTLAEINRIISRNIKTGFAVGGLIAPLIDTSENAVQVSGSIAVHAASIFSESRVPSRRDIAQWPEAGAGLVRLHPWFPDLIVEIETYSGCPRDKHCSFCTEGLNSRTPQFRDPDDILREIKALSAAGITRFRLGQQADILQYRSTLSHHRNGFPEPAIASIKYLFNSLEMMVRSGSITVLNIDNANPGTIANFPEESSQIIDIISRAVTPGDTMALGIESFDPEVIKKNSLKVSPEEAHRAIRIINMAGGMRREGLPAILPGVNLLHGLTGEGPDTFKKNYIELKRTLDEGMLIKRINIRQVQPYPGTPLALAPPRVSAALRNRFLYFKERIRSEIDNPMLKQIYPPGTVLKNCMVMEKREGYSYLKQISSYAITLISAEDLCLKKFYDMLVVGHRERSLKAVPISKNLNSLSVKSIETVSGIGRVQASEIIMRRPFSEREKAEALLGSVDSAVKEMLLAGIK